MRVQTQAKAKNSVNPRMLVCTYTLRRQSVTSKACRMKVNSHWEHWRCHHTKHSCRGQRHYTSEGCSCHRRTERDALATGGQRELLVWRTLLPDLGRRRGGEKRGVEWRIEGGASRRCGENGRQRETCVSKQLELHRCTNNAEFPSKMKPKAQSEYSLAPKILTEQEKCIMHNYAFKMHVSSNILYETQGK